MSKAIANLDDLKRLQGSVRKAEEQITQAIKQLHRDLDRADWNDDAKRNFEGKLKEATRFRAARIAATAGVTADPAALDQRFEHLSEAIARIA